jgi:hypothetical protein
MRRRIQVCPLHDSANGLGALPLQELRIGERRRSHVHAMT